MKKIIIILISILVLCITGCGKENPKTVTQVNETKNETEITKSIKQVIVTSENVAEYKFETSKNKITVKVKYDNTKFKYEDKDIKGELYIFHVGTDEYKNSLFEVFDSQYKIGGFDAMTSTTDIEIFTTIKIDNNTVVYITCSKNGYYTVEEIIADKDYKDIISNIQINVEEK